MRVDVISRLNRQKTGQALSLFIILVAMLVLVGWGIGFAPLTTLLPGLASMKVNTALNFVLLGLSTFIFIAGKDRFRWLQRVSAVVIVVIGALTLVEYSFSVSLGIDEFFLADPVSAIFPGRMSPFTAFSFVLLGLVLLIPLNGKGRLHTALIFATIFITYSVFVSYLYGVVLTDFLVSYTTMAIHTAALFLLAACLLFIHQPGRLAGLLLTAGPVGQQLRRLLLAAALVPLVVGGLGIWGQRLGLYEPTLGLALIAVLTTGLLSIFAWFNALFLEERTEENRRVMAGQFQMAIESAPYAIIIVNQSGEIVLVNSRAEKDFGYNRTELVGEQVDRLVPIRYRQQHVTHRDGFYMQPEDRPMGVGRDLFGLRKDGTEFPVEIGLAPLEMQKEIQVMATIIDITKRKHAEIELQQTLQELKRSNTELEQFAYIASHDLQEPLRMVSSYMELIESRYREELPQDAKEFIDFAVDGANRMQSLIQDLLAFSRVGTRGKEPQPVQSQEALEIALANLHSLIAENDAVIESEDLLPVMADESQLVQVFQNLIGNAIKFRSQETPHIKVAAGQRNGVVEFSVADNGIGFDPKHNERIFVIFQRLNHRDLYPGTGIGLAICKKIIERHGGQIWTESQPDQGSCFYFTLPVVSQDEQHSKS